MSGSLAENSQRGRVEASVGKEIRKFQPITPRELGWIPSTPRLSYTDQPLTIQTTQDAEGRTVYLCGFPPVRGPQFLRVLTSATFSPDQAATPISTAGVLDDWGLFRDAKTKWDDKAVLDRHMKNKKIKDAMVAFGETYVDSWIHCLEGDEPTLAAVKAKNIQLVDMRYFPEKFLTGALADPEFHYHSFIGASPSSLTLFNQFLTDDPARSIPVDLTDIRWDGVESGGYTWASKFTRVRKGYQKQIFAGYVRWLAKRPEERDALVKEYALNRELAILIDFSTGSPEIYQSNHYTGEYQDVSVDCVDNVVTVEDDSMQIVSRIQPSQTSDKAHPYTIASETITLKQDDTHARAITPVIAWRQEEASQGQRSKRVLLSLDETTTLFGERLNGGKVDDEAGTIAASCYMPTVHARVPEKMALTKGGFEQPIGPAQISVWMNRKNIKRWIASDPDGIFASIENLTASPVTV